jgi:asparagine synthase (glutamine-hydrolysing)
VPPYRESQTESYWSMKEVAARGQSHIFTGSREEAAEELERLLKEALREQMVADVPVGAFLSAGIDSSTIVALMQALLTERVKSFTIGMPAPMTDEAVPAKRVAAHLGLDHTEHYISEDDAKAIIPLLGGMFGEPFADASQIPTYLVSKITREHVTVSLSGDAGDELFCGYNSYRSVERIKQKLGRVPYFIRYPASRVLLSGLIPLSRDNRIRAHLLGLNNTAQLYINSYEFDTRLRQISKTDKAIPYKYVEIPPEFMPDPSQQVMLMDLLMYHPDDILVKVDRAAMAVSLETRVPLLDKDIIEFAWSLPLEYKRNKAVLRAVLYRHVPRELMERPKQGFGIPVGSWLKEPGLRAWAEQLIARDTLKRQGLLNPDIVHQIWGDFIARDLFIPQIWHILMFQNFMESRKL